MVCFGASHAHGTYSAPKSASASACARSGSEAVARKHAALQPPKSALTGLHPYSMQQSAWLTAQPRGCSACQLCQAVEDCSPHYMAPGVAGVSGLDKEPALAGAQGSSTVGGGGGSPKGAGGGRVSGSDERAGDGCGTGAGGGAPVAGARLCCRLPSSTGSSAQPTRASGGERAASRSAWPVHPTQLRAGCLPACPTSAAGAGCAGSAGQGA